MSQQESRIPDYRRPVPGGGGAGVVLSDEQLKEIQRSKKRAQKVFRAATVSRIDGGIMAFFAVGALASFCFGLSGVILGAALAFVAVNSFRGAKRLLAFDEKAPAFLALNQMFLAASVILYAAYSLHAGLTGKSELTEQLGGLNGADISIAGMSPEGLGRMIYWTLYGGLIIGTIIAQGGAAWYYGSRVKYVRAYLKETPKWVVDLQKAQAG